jgi:hypothetical protein
MASVHSVTKHLVKAIKGARADAERATVYRKTSQAYSTDVVQLLQEFAQLVSEVTGLSVTVSVDSEASYEQELQRAKRHVSEKSNACAAVERAARKRHPAEDYATSSLESTVNDLKQMCQGLNEKYDSLLTLLSSGACASSLAAPASKSEQSNQVEKVGPMTRVSSVKEAQRVPVIMHQYSEGDIDSFRNVLFECAGHCQEFDDEQYANFVGSVYSWFNFRYVTHRAYRKDENGNESPAYGLKSAPGWMVAYSLLYANSLFTQPNADDYTLTIMYEWKMQVWDNPKNTYAVPCELQKSNLKNLNLTQEQVDKAYSFWRKFCDLFNTEAAKQEVPVRLYYDQFASKLKLARLFNDDFVRQYL